MSLPPSAMFDNHSVADGFSGFSSDAPYLEYINSLHLAEWFLVLYAIYNLGMFLHIDFESFANLSGAVYHTTINWIAYLHQDILTIRNARAIPQCILNFMIQLPSSILDKVKAISHFLGDAFNLLPWLTRTWSTADSRPETITVHTLILSNHRTATVIHGIPSNVSAPELRRYLETKLWTQYYHQFRAQRTGNTILNNAGNTNDTDEMTIDTSSPGLWREACVSIDKCATSLPSSSWVATPTSKTSSSDTSATVGRTPRALIPEASASGASGSTEPKQHRSTSRRA